MCNAAIVVVGRVKSRSGPSKPSLTHTLPLRLGFGCYECTKVAVFGLFGEYSRSCSQLQPAANDAEASALPPLQRGLLLLHSFDHKRAEAEEEARYCNNGPTKL